MVRRLGSLLTTGAAAPARGKRRLAAGAVAVAAVVTAVTALDSASAYEQGDKRNPHHEWVQIVAKGAPTWSAEMWLYNSNGQEIHHWDVNDKVGGKETWWFTRKGGSLRLRVSTKNKRLSWEHKEFSIKYNDPEGHCFLISSMGELRYTGNSETGGCTPA
jgi:hypothetical protein